MTSPRPKGPYFKASFLDQYDLPPYAQQDDDDGHVSLSIIERLIAADQDFVNDIGKSSKLANSIVAEQNYFFHQQVPPVKWQWSNSGKRERDMILNTLLTKGRLAILQKQRLHTKIRFIECKADRSLALKECNEQLKHVFSLLDAFHCFDERIASRRKEVDDAYVNDPYVYGTATKLQLIPIE